MMVKSKYEAPELEMFELQVEKGFAQSSTADINPNPWVVDDEDKGTWDDE